VILKFIQNLQIDPFPIRSAFKGYSFDGLQRDIQAGITGALLAFPQAIAYAIIAGLPISYGIWCSAIAALVGPLFASSRLAILGPTNATAAMMLSLTLTLPPEAIGNVGVIALLVCMVGGLLIAGAFLQLAFLLRFISQSVIIGYITAAGIFIIANQSQHLFGLTVERGITFVDTIKKTGIHMAETEWPAVVIAVVTFAFLILLKKSPRLKNLRVAISLLVASGVAYLLAENGFSVHMVDPLPFGEWPLTPPAISMSTFTLLFGPAMAMAFLAALENTVMTKTIASSTGTNVNPNQELLSLGFANLASGFTHGMVASTSPVRSTLNLNTGAVSQVSSMLNGVLCIGGALLLGPAIGYLPKAGVAAVVVNVALALIKPERIRVAWKSTSSDAITLATTFGSALLLPLHIAIFIGVATSIALFLKKASAPQLVEYGFNDEGQLAEVENQRANPRISIIHAEGDLFFGAADLFRDEVRKVCHDPLLRIVVLRLRNARHLDATTIFALEDLIKFLRSTGRDVVVSGAKRDVYKIFRDTGLLKLLDKKNFFMSSEKNPNVSTRNALKRAQEIIGTDKADIQIYYDPSKKKKDS